MFPPQDTPGYGLLLLLIFLPGLGVGEFFGVWRKDDTLAERFGFAFGLGLAVDTLVLAVRTSGIDGLAGIDLWTLYSIIIAGASLLLASVARRRSLLLLRRPRGTDFLASLLVLAVSAIILMNFEKYPIFPQYSSADYSAHIATAQGLVSGSIVSIPSGILYYGVHYQLASALLFVGGDPLVTVRQTMAILVILSPLLVYAGAGRLLGRGASLVATAIYSLSGTIWFASVFNAGLYPNFFGILAAFFLILAFMDASTNARSPRLWLVFLLALCMAYFSHYTIVTLVPTLLFFPGAGLLQRSKEVRPFVLASAVALSPGAAVAALDPGFVSRLLYLGSSGGGLLVGSTALSSALSVFPVVGYMALEVYDDAAFVALLLFAAVGLVWAARKRNPSVLFLAAWLLVLIAAAPFDVSAWRFSLEALVPLTLLAGLGVFVLLPRLKTVRAGKKSGYLKLGFVLFVLLGVVAIGSWGTQSVSDSTTVTSVNAAAQLHDLDAILWLGANTSGGSILSVSDYNYLYAPVLVGRQADFQFLSTPAQALPLAKAENYSYIVVTRVVTASVPPIPSLFPWNNFPTSSNANLTLVYSTSDVRIYRVA